ncbi:protein containing DUF820 [Candidatus Magnetomorum sp. HK-1]|nr:protein containing DUF820 [Candidatus Magnetomorum sp. HK-1]
MEAIFHTQQQSYSHPYLFDSPYTRSFPHKKSLHLNTTNKYEGLRVSEEEYWLKYYEFDDVALEWNNGILEEKPVSDRESYDLYSWFLRLITQYSDVFKEGMLIGLEIGFKLKIGNKTTIRKPDLAFIHKDNPVQMSPQETTYKGCFDICFEFLSDSNTKAIERDTVVKKHEYEKYGVSEYYIFDRLGDETAFYYLNSKGKYKEIKPDRNGVIKSRVLKNFQFRLDDIYNRPVDKILANDSVYSEYVMVDYQKEYKRAEAERKKAEKSDRKAEAERKKAEKSDKKAEAERKRAETERKRAETERKRAEAERKKAEAERKKAEKSDKKAEVERKKAEAERKKAKAERERADRLEKELMTLRKSLEKSSKS